MTNLSRQTEQQCSGGHWHCSHISDWFTRTNTDTNKDTNTCQIINTNKYITNLTEIQILIQIKT